MKFSEMPYTRVDFPAVIAQAQEIIQRALLRSSQKMRAG